MNRKDSITNQITRRLLRGYAPLKAIPKSKMYSQLKEIERSLSRAQTNLGEVLRSSRGSGLDFSNAYNTVSRALREIKNLMRAL